MFTDSKRVKIPFKTEYTFHINNRKRSRSRDDDFEDDYEKYEKYSKIERDDIIYRVSNIAVY
jgi:hypothetical protein